MRRLTFTVLLVLASCGPPVVTEDDAGVLPLDGGFVRDAGTDVDAGHPTDAVTTGMTPAEVTAAAGAPCDVVTKGLPEGEELWTYCRDGGVPACVRFSAQGRVVEIIEDCRG